MDRLSRLASSKWAPTVLFLVAAVTFGLGAYLGGVHSDDGDRSGINMTLNYLNGDGFSLMSDFGPVYSFIPPGMSFIDLFLYPLFGENGWQARILFVLMSAASCSVLFYVGKRILEPTFAFLAALWWALYPPQWFWASRMNPQVYATNMVIVCLLLIYRAWDTRNFYLPLVVGLLWATISLCRGEYALGIFIFAAVSLLVFSEFKTGMLFALLFIVGWAGGMAPWVIRNYNLHHRFLLITTNAGQNIWKAYNPDYNFSGVDIPYPPELFERLKAIPNEVDRGEELKKEALKFIKENPQRALRNFVGNLLGFWRPWLSPSAVSLKQQIVYLVSYLPLFGCFVLGLFKIPWKDPKWLALGMFLLYKWLIHSVFYVIVRYREAVMPLFVLIAVYALQYYWHQFEKEKRHA